jgi:hypothetical protein
MRTIEYHRWSPQDSPLRVEFQAELLLELGWAEASGILYGSRHGEKIRIAALTTPWDEEPEKVGVYFSRARGEVFLTETDLAFMSEQQAGLALVVVGKRAGFFVREKNGSIQTVRSREEFSTVQTQETAAPNIAIHPRAARRVYRPRWTWAPVGLAMLAGLPIAALAVFPQHMEHTTERPTEQTAGQTAAPFELDVHKAGGQLRISWKPGQSAMLVIEDRDKRLTTPVYADQSNVTYVPQGEQVNVSLMTTDAAGQPRRERALYVSSLSGPP